MQKNNDEDILTFSANPPPEQAVRRAKPSPVQAQPAAAKAAQPVQAPADNKGAASARDNAASPEKPAQAASRSKEAEAKPSPVQAQPAAAKAAQPVQAPADNKGAAPARDNAASPEKPAQAASQPKEAEAKPSPVQAQPAAAKAGAVSVAEENAVTKSDQTSEHVSVPNPLVLPPAVQTSLKKIFSRVKESAPVQFISGLSLKAKLLLCLIFLPALCVFLYYGLIASPMYVTETRFAVRGPDSGGPGAGLVGMLVPAASSVGMDANIISEYIQSPDIMEEIDAETGILSHFSSDEYDYLTRLSANATRDEKLSYWNWAVKPMFDLESGIIALEVKAYEPAIAQKLAEAVLAKSEALVNTMNERARTDAIAQAMEEVKNAEKRVKAAQDALREFRNKSGMLDPVSTAGGLQNIVSYLESEVVKTRAEIAQASTYMSKNAPALVGLKARLEAVEKQLESEKLRLAGEETRTDSLSAFAGDYAALQTESEFATKQLVSAMTALESARVKAEAKSRYVVAFQKAALPDESLYPKAWLFAIYVFLGTLAFVALASLIIAAVREHAGF